MRIKKKDLREAMEQGDGVLFLEEHGFKHINEVPKYLEDMIYELEEDTDLTLEG